MATPSEERVWMSLYSPDIPPMPEMSAYRYIRTSNANREDEVVLDFFGSSIKHSELWDMIERIAASLDAIGIKEDDVITLVTVAAPESIALFYALNKIGATANTIDPRMDRESILQRAETSGIKKAFVLDAVYERAGNVLTKNGYTLYVIPSTGSVSALKRMIASFKLPKVTYGPNVIRWKDFIAFGEGRQAPEAPYVGDRTAAITYTGGTTGTPKGVMLTNDSINAVAENFKISAPTFNNGQSFLDIIPMFTSYGLVTGLHMPISKGGRLIIIPKFVPEDFGKLVMKYRPNHMIATPAYCEMMLSSKEVKGKDLSFIYTLGSGGDNISRGLEDWMLSEMKAHNMPYRLSQGYGMSEVSSAATASFLDIYKPGTVGAPCPLSIVGIFDTETGKELGYNETGEICMAGPIIMKGYWKEPEETAEIMKKHDDGMTWIHSGDLGFLDEDGFLHVMGRLKRMITRFDGHKVFPTTLENLLTYHDHVVNCAVIGVKDLDHRIGHMPLALVELEPGCDKDAVRKELLKVCDEDVEDRGKPVDVIVVDSMPLTSMGKNDNIALEKIYGEYRYK